MVPIYWGIFVPSMMGSLDHQIDDQHVTFGFRTEFPQYLYGEAAKIKVIGYGNDGQNEAYLVEIPDQYMNIYSGNIPHITLSIANGAKPVNSRRLRFDPVEPLVIEGQFGYFDCDGVHLK